jgi:hypothetical protein
MFNFAIVVNLSMKQRLKKKKRLAV